MITTSLDQVFALKKLLQAFLNHPLKVEEVANVTLQQLVQEQGPSSFFLSFDFLPFLLLPHYYHQFILLIPFTYAITSFTVKVDYYLLKETRN